MLLLEQIYSQAIPIMCAMHAIAPAIQRGTACEDLSSLNIYRVLVEVEAHGLLRSK